MGVIPKVQLPGKNSKAEALHPVSVLDWRRKGGKFLPRWERRCCGELGGGWGIGVGVTIRVSIYQLLVCWS